MRLQSKIAVITGGEAGSERNQPVYSPVKAHLSSLPIFMQKMGRALFQK